VRLIKIGLHLYLFKDSDEIFTAVSWVSLNGEMTWNFIK
jgi:hypothetical protein